MIRTCEPLYQPAFAGVGERLEVFKIRLFKEYKKYVLFNLCAAAILAVLLIVIAFKADDLILDGWEFTTVLMVAASILPGPISLGVLWFDAGRQLKPLQTVADELEERAMRSVGEVIR